MTASKRKIGEKATLLNKCGELLFGCSGELLATQGIYVPKSLTSSPLCFLCKRNVWVPLSLSHECLVHNLESFGATLPFSVQKVASLHRLGLCGIDPTRTVHATDKHFLLLAKFPHKHFAVYGILETRKSSSNNITLIESITTNHIDVLNCVEWIKSETTLHHLSKRMKNKRTDHHIEAEEKSDQEGQLIEAESQTPGLSQETEQHQSQHESAQKESELSISTPECQRIAPCEHLNQPNVIFKVVYPLNPQTMLWTPFLPPQVITEASGCASPFCLTQQPPSSLSKPLI